MEQYPAIWARQSDARISPARKLADLNALVAHCRRCGNHFDKNFTMKLVANYPSVELLQGKEVDEMISAHMTLYHLHAIRVETPHSVARRAASASLDHRSERLFAKTRNRLFCCTFSAWHRTCRRRRHPTYVAPTTEWGNPLPARNGR